MEIPTPDAEPYFIEVNNGNALSNSTYSGLGRGLGLNGLGGYPGLDSIQYAGLNTAPMVGLSTCFQNSNNQGLSPVLLRGPTATSMAGPNSGEKPQPRFCPHCAGCIKPQFQFCPQCGGALAFLGQN